MNDKNESENLPDRLTDADARAAWVTPLVHRIDAGEAEVGTRAASDGMFSTS